ncbi:MAG TPA: hypothetical protein VIJ82_21940 [Streptosporangiaceae bacterium]
MTAQDPAAAAALIKAAADRAGGVMIAPDGTVQGLQGAQLGHQQQDAAQPDPGDAR